MRPDFAVVEQIRARHLEDVQANTFEGRAWQAHEDRAMLLAIIAFFSAKENLAQPEIGGGGSTSR